MGRFGDTKKFYLVEWKVSCSPMKEGSLGIRKFSSFNQALLKKWLQKFGVEGYRLWRRVIFTKYGE